MTRRRFTTLLALAGLLPPSAWAAQESGQELASRGHDLYVSGRPGEAVAVLREAAKADPANPWIFNLLGRAAWQAGDARQAAEAFSTALRIDASDGYARMMLDILSQKPGPRGLSGPPSVSGRSRRPSRLEEEAGAELKAFSETGSRPGGKVVVVDAGHGGADRGVTGASGTAEKDVCLDLAIRLAAALENGGARAVLTREADYEVPLWARAAMAGLFTADVFVSLHCTAAEDRREGADVFAYAPRPTDPAAHAVAELENGVVRFERRPAPPGPLPDAWAFMGSWRERRAHAAGARLAAALGPAMGGARPAGVGACPLTVLRNSAAPSVLVEAGYLTSRRDEERLRAPAELERLAASLAAALTRFPG